MGQKVIQRTFSHVLWIFLTRLCSVLLSHPDVVWWLRLQGCHYAQVDGLGVARELRELQGTIACRGAKLTASEHSRPSHGQPWPATALPSAEREPCLDRHVFQLQCWKPDRAGNGTGRGKRGVRVFGQGRSGVVQ